jgi:hypothetical protein
MAARKRLRPLTTAVMFLIGSSAACIDAESSGRIWLLSENQQYSGWGERVYDSKFPKEGRTPAIPRDVSGRERQRVMGLQTLAGPASHSASRSGVNIRFRYSRVFF